MFGLFGLAAIIGILTSLPSFEIIELLRKYIPPEIIPIAVVLWVLGLFLKQTHLKDTKWKIPIYLLIAGIILTIVWYGVIGGKGFLVAETYALGLYNGILAAGMAVFGYTLFKQTTEKKN